MSTFNKGKFLNALKHYTGSDQFYASALYKGRGYRYTEGIKFLSTETESYWLIDFIFSNQIASLLQSQKFQVWTITCADNQAQISVTDGHSNHICDYQIPYSDFPLEQFTVWLVGTTLLLPSEY